MSAITISESLFILLLILARYTVGPVFCQGDEGLVYFGTGTNGSHNREYFNNYTVILGGLFSIHTDENNVWPCTSNPYPIY